MSFIGLEIFWKKDQTGTAKVKLWTVLQKIQVACRRIKEWIKKNRHLKGKIFIKTLNLVMRLGEAKFEQQSR